MKCLWLILVLLSANVASAQTKPVNWDQWSFLLGRWEAVGQGSPGESKGGFSFALDLQRRVIVEKSHTDYAALPGRPAFAHDDLMMIYADDSSRNFHADYYDNEGHVIRYTIEFSSDGKNIIFLSDPIPSQPRFRLTYSRVKDSQLAIRFEIASPEAPASFKVYVEGTARKIALDQIR